MNSLEHLAIALVPGVAPGKWLDRWQERRPDVPFTVDIIAESDQLNALADRQLLFARTRPDGTGSDGRPVRGAHGLLTIPLYEEQPVLVAPLDHEASLTDVFPLSSLAASELLDLPLLGYEQAMELAGNGAGVVVVPQAVARMLARKDTVVRPVTDAPAEDLGLTTRRPEGDDAGLAPEDISRLMEPTRVWLCFAKSWQDPDTGENHPVIEEFIGIVRGRKAESSRQPSVLERQQEEAKVRLKERQSSQSKAAAEQKAKKPVSRGGRPGGGAGKGQRRPAKGRGKR